MDRGRVRGDLFTHEEDPYEESNAEAFWQDNPGHAQHTPDIGYGEYIHEWNNSTNRAEAKLDEIRSLRHAPVDVDSELTYDQVRENWGHNEEFAHDNRRQLTERINKYRRIMGSADRDAHSYDLKTREDMILELLALRAV
jgi:hypothetical protein